MAHAALYRSRLDSRLLVHRLHDLLAARVMKHMSTRAVNHVVVALLGLIDAWLRAGMPHAIDLMAAVCERLIIRAAWAALDPAHPSADLHP